MKPKVYMEKYHSSLREELPGLKPLTSFSNKGSQVFQWDLCNGLLESHWEQCDVFYSELAWKDGYDRFVERAETQSGSFARYIRELGEFIVRDSRPVYLTSGRHIQNLLPRADYLIPSNLNGADAITYVYHDRANYENLKRVPVELIIRSLTIRFDCVGDFCAGYGNTCRFFLEQGKRFVASDINPKCVYYIAKTLMDYEDIQ